MIMTVYVLEKILTMTMPVILILMLTHVAIVKQSISMIWRMDMDSGMMVALIVIGQLIVHLLTQAHEQCV